MTETLTIRRPDDWHVHLRDGPMLPDILAHTARQFARAIVMPNLSPPITTTAAAAAYRERIIAALPTGSDFKPLMVLYLTDDTDPADVERGFALGILTACKLYPAHATTNSAHGVTDIRTIYPVLDTMQELGMPLLVHGEVTDPAIDIFDREAVFIEQVLLPTLRDFPALRVVFEHITRRPNSWPAPAKPLPPRSPRITLRSIATRCSLAGCGRMPTACRWPSARFTGWRCARR